MGYIKRQDAIDELMEMVKTNSGDQFGGVLLHYTGIKAMLERIEPANVRPVVHGTWIETYDDPIVAGRCSVCGWEANLYEDDVIGMNYCPNCGAYMLELEQK